MCSGIRSNKSVFFGCVAYGVIDNVLGLAEGGALKKSTCQTTNNDYSEPKSFCQKERPAFGKVLLVAVFIFLSSSLS